MAQVFPLLLLFLHPQAEQSGDSGWERLRRIAESQHEIVMLHIKREEFDEAMQVSRNIFGLDFPAAKRHLFVKEGRIIADALVHHKQYPLAHSILDLALEVVLSNLNKAALLKEKAYICKKEGKDEDAMRLARKALELERSSP